MSCRCCIFTFNIFYFFWRFELSCFCLFVPPLEDDGILSSESEDADLESEDDDDDFEEIDV